MCVCVRVCLERGREIDGEGKTLEPRKTRAYIYRKGKAGKKRIKKKKLVKNKLRTPQKRIYNERRVFSERTCQKHWEGEGDRACPFSSAFHLQRELERGPAQARVRDVYAQ